MNKPSGVWAIKRCRVSPLERGLRGCVNYLESVLRRAQDERTCPPTKTSPRIGGYRGGKEIFLPFPPLTGGIRGRVKDAIGR